MGRPRLYTDDELLATLCRYAELIGETPAAIRMDQDVKHLDWLHCHTIYIGRFGSWNAAIERAGLDPRPARGVAA